jgi:hypothetical protein
MIDRDIAVNKNTRKFCTVPFPDSFTCTELMRMANPSEFVKCASHAAPTVSWGRHMLPGADIPFIP